MARQFAEDLRDLGLVIATEPNAGARRRWERQRVTTLTMLDSDLAADIPTSAAAVAGYGDGEEGTWSAQDWARFPAAKKLVIVRKYVDAGDCLDIEKAAASIAQARGWVTARQAAGLGRPWLYISVSQFAALQAAVEDLTVGFWVASWTGQPHEIPGADAVQYASPSVGSPGHYDLSHVTGTFPGDPLPVPAAPAPAPQGVDVQVATLEQGSGGQDVKAVQAILNAKAGARLAVDGSYGPETAAAVSAWQKFFDLAVDGVCGPATWPTLIDL